MKKLLVAIFAIFISTNWGVYAQIDMRSLAMACDSLNQCVAKAMESGDYVLAQQLGEQNVKMLRKSFVEDHEFTAKSLLNLAHAYACSGDWDLAWKNADASAKMWKSLFSNGNANYAIALGDAAYYNARKANYSYAKADAAKALEIWEGQDINDVMVESRLLHGVAFTHFLLGEYEDAKRLTNRAVSILSDASCKQSAQYGVALSLLAAATSRTQNDQNDAIAFATTALSVQQKVLPTVSFDKAVTMGRLSMAYVRKGDMQNALDFGTKALEMWDTLGTLPVEYEDCGWLMASMLNANRRFDKALGLCERLSKHSEATGAINSLQYANLLAGAAQAHYGLEQYNEAVEVQKKSIAVVERVKSKEYNSLPSAYHNYAIYLIKGERNKEAIKAQEHSVKLSEKLYKNQPRHADALSRLALLHASIGDYASAAAVQLKATEILAQCGASYKTELIEGLNNLASYQFHSENTSDALVTEERLIGIYKESGDTVHKNFSVALANAGLYADKCQNSPLAIGYQRRSLDVLKKVILPTEDPYIEGLTLLVKYCTEASNYKDAATAQQELAELNARKYGSKSQEYASNLELLASMLSLDNRMHEAIAIQEKVTEIYTSPNIDESTRNDAINRLAELHSKAGHYDEASRLSAKVDSLTQSGDISPEQAERLLGAASHQQLAGNHAEALRLSSRALDVLEHTSAKGSRQHANALSDLAGYYAMVHNNEDAIAHAAQAASIYEALGDTLNLATSLNNLALFYARSKDNAAVDSLTSRALHLVELSVGMNSVEYARILNNVASNTYTIGNCAKADSIGGEAIHIFSTLGLDDTPEFANLLNNQSVYLLNLNRTGEALDLIDRSIALRKSTLGSRHPEYLHAVVNHCSILSTIDGESDRLVKRATESSRLLTEMLRRQFSSLPAAERSSYWNAWNTWYRHDLLCYARSHPSPELVSAAYEGTLFAKGLMLNSECNLKDLIAEASSDEINLLYTRLQEIRSKLNDLYEHKSASGESHELEVTDSLEHVANALERQLVSKSRGYGDYTANLNIPASSVRAALLEGEAAVEFVSFGSKENPVYYAFLMTKEDTVPQYIEVTSASRLHAVRNDRSELSRVVWSEVAAHMPPEISTIYFAPDGDLYSLPIEYLPDFANSSTLLSARWQMHRLSSTRQLAHRGEEDQISGACVIGGLAYNTDGTPSPYDLPQTLVEANSIHKQLLQRMNGVELLTGTNGTEKAVRGLSGKRTGLLHIATHGFCISEEDADYQACDIFSSTASGASHAEDNMLRRSGLMLYGAAPTLLGRGPSNSSEDGVLTAMEIARLDLRNLDLAVLSACQTALGDVTGEGVFGLQRGFKKAGARSLLMSLWKVDDGATCLLMDRFYANLGAGMTKSRALAEAQQYLRDYTPPAYNWDGDEMYDPEFEDDIPVDEHPYRAPEFWSAFVLLDAI